MTELIQRRHLREDFSHSVLEGQSEERGGIAREIHDSAMQLLAAMGLTIGQLKRVTQPEATVEIVAEMEHLRPGNPARIADDCPAGCIRRCSRNWALEPVRCRLSPMALPAATGLNIAVQVELTTGISPAVEVALYRMVQEALSNVNRHAGATERRRRDPAQAEIMPSAKIGDDGTGMPTHIRHGVGLGSMRSRVAEPIGRLASPSPSAARHDLGRFSSAPCKG